jgi:hypothetical protein
MWSRPIEELAVRNVELDLSSMASSAPGLGSQTALWNHF